ncbi:MAG: hypothetical protein RR619_05900 [Raoultibacter sp.]
MGIESFWAKYTTRKPTNHGQNEKNVQNDLGFSTQNRANYAYFAQKIAKILLKIGQTSQFTG